MCTCIFFFVFLIIFRGKCLYNKVFSTVFFYVSMFSNLNRGYYRLLVHNYLYLNVCAFFQTSTTQRTLLELQKQQGIEKNAFCEAVTGIIEAQEKKFETLFKKVEKDFKQEEQFFANLQTQLKNYRDIRQTTKFTMMNEIETARITTTEALRHLRNRGGAAFMANESEIEDVRQQTQTSSAELLQFVSEAEVRPLSTFHITIF